MSLSSHQKPGQGETNDWLTPPEIINALGPFDLDPCASTNQPWQTANQQFTVLDDGFHRPWKGYTWVNPPFGPHAGGWLLKLADHGDGIGLCAARTETSWFQKAIWQHDNTTGVLFLSRRPHFHRPDGVRADANSGAPICLVAYGDHAFARLRDSGLSGAMVTEWWIQ